MTTTEPLQVLIAEDESLVADLIEHMLEKIGMKVVGRAIDGRQAVEFARTLRPGVVLMDIAMPQMDGITAAAAIQAECPTPVVILTAHEAKEDVAKATSAGVGAYLVKPARPDDIERAITIAVARHADLLVVRQTNQALTQTLDEVKTLKGLLPICCSCKKIRDDQGYWDSVEHYIGTRTDAEFTHGYCPQCIGKYFPGCVPAAGS